MNLETEEDVEAGLVVEGAEGDVARLAGRGLEALMDDVECRAAADVRRPRAFAHSGAHAVEGFEVQGHHVGYLTPFEVGVGPEEDILAEDRAHLRVNAEHDQLGIKAYSRSGSQAPAASFLPNVVLDISHCWGYRCSIAGRGCPGGTSRRGAGGSA